MAKDVIYIDVEDDITSIVGKVKQSTEKIVALVPPNRIGVLQSAVNMRLLQRVAEQSAKSLVLITNNKSLSVLAGTAKIPVAKNLQSKPELAEIPILKIDGDDMIDGEELPVGDLDKVSQSNHAEDRAVESAINDGLASISTDKKPQKKSGQKVPDFSSFRKKFFIILGLSLGLVGFLVWAIWFAPKATVIVTAKTTTATIDRNVTLLAEGSTDVSGGSLRAVAQEVTSDLSVEFTPTGKKRVGDKATGTMELTRTSVSSNPLVVPAGTSFSAGDYTFVSTESATLAGTSIGPGGIVQSTAIVRVEAAKIGEEYNLSSRKYTSNVGGFSANGSKMSGGTSREVTAVSEGDIARARDELDSKKDDGIKKKVTDLFTSSDIVITDSYREERSEPVSSVPVGEEATSTVVLKTTMTASMLGVAEADVVKLIEVGVNRELEGEKSQKMYDNGLKGLKFSQFSSQGDTPTVRITVNATIGPMIDEAQVKESVKGKRFGDVQSSLTAIQGVDDVDVKFSPFWVRTIPNDVKRITIEFRLQNAS